MGNKFEAQAMQRKAKENRVKEKELLEQKRKKEIRDQVNVQFGEAKKVRAKEEQIASVMDDFLAKPAINVVLQRNEKGLNKIFKYFCKQ